MAPISHLIGRILLVRMGSTHGHNIRLFLCQSEVVEGYVFIFCRIMNRLLLGYQNNMRKLAFHSQRSLLSSISVESNTEDHPQKSSRLQGAVPLTQIIKLFSYKWFCVGVCVYCHSLASYVIVHYNGYTSIKARITTQRHGQCPC